MTVQDTFKRAKITHNQSGGSHMSGGTSGTSGGTNTNASGDNTSTNASTSGTNIITNTTQQHRVKVLFSSMIDGNENGNENNSNNNRNENDNNVKNSFFIPISSSTADLNLLLNSVLKHNGDQNDDDGDRDFNFYVDDQLIIKSLDSIFISSSNNQANNTTTANETASIGLESTIIIQYIPKSVFKVRSVNRCSSTMTGHSQPVLALAYSPNGRMLASGSGDNTVRLWDLATETPRACLTGHTGWVQHVAWSPDCAYVCSAGMDGKIGIWESKKGTLVAFIKAHTQPITSLTFEPFHLNPSASRFISTSKDGTGKVWDLHHRSSPVSILSGHTAPVTCSVWTGTGDIYTGSRDKIIKKWREERRGGGFMWKGEMKGHAHWVNRLAVQSDFILRTGPYDYTDPVFSDKESAHQAALARYNSFIKTHISSSTGELLASCSDDFTIILWPTNSHANNNATTTKPLNRMTGHQQAVNSLCFSPDGGVLATASFDKSVKLWRINGSSPGLFLETLRGHVGAVYQVSFSSDARKLASASRDSTVKIWDVEACLGQATSLRTGGGKTKSMKGKMVAELSGHEDEVWCVEWAPDGNGVCSGGKDKCLKIWKH